MSFAQYKYSIFNVQAARVHSTPADNTEGNFHMVQNFAVFVDRSAATKIKTTKISV